MHIENNSIFIRIIGYLLRKKKKRKGKVKPNIPFGILVNIILTRLYFIYEILSICISIRCLWEKLSLSSHIIF